MPKVKAEPKTKVEKPAEDTKAEKKSAKKVVKVAKKSKVTASPESESKSETPVEVVAETEAVVGTEPAVSVVEADKAEAETKPQPKKPGSSRGRKYVASRSNVDRTKKYDLTAAIELVKKLSYTKFDGTISVDGVVKSEGDLGELSLPHSTGQARRVAVVTDALLADITAGKIEFDVLLSSPEYMPKLARLAKVLGPKGLMPNPKNGTLTQNPEKKIKEFEAGKMLLKTQRKMPVFHAKIGKVSMDTKHLVENLSAIIDLVGMRLQKLTISASMSPGVKVDISQVKA